MDPAREKSFARFGVRTAVGARSILDLILALMLAINPSGAPAEAVGASDTFTIYTDTKLVDPRYRSFVQARLDQLHPRDLEHLQLVTKDGIDLLGLEPRQPVEIMLFLPEDLSPADSFLFLREIDQHLNRHFPVIAFKLRRAYLPTLPLGPSNLDSLMPGGEGRQIEKAWKNWTARTHRYIDFLKIHSHLPETADLTLGTMVGAGRALAGVGYWLSVTGFNKFGLSQSAITVLLSLVFAVFPTQMNLWKAEHMIPFLQNEFFVHYYNTHPFLKTATINELLTYVAQTAFRQLSHLAEPVNVASPFTVGFLKAFLALGVIRSLMGAAEDYGGVMLLKKGYMSRRMAQAFFNFFGIESQINAYLFASGRVQWMPYTLTFEAVTRGLVWMVAQWLPARHNRLLILHPELSATDRDQIEYVQGLRDLYLSDSSVKAQNLEEILKARNWVLKKSSPTP